MIRIRRFAFVACIAIVIAGLVAGAAPFVLIDNLDPVDPIFSTILSFTPSGYDGAILPQLPSLEVRSPRAPPLA